MLTHYGMRHGGRAVFILKLRTYTCNTPVASLKQRDVSLSFANKKLIIVHHKDGDNFWITIANG